MNWRGYLILNEVCDYEWWIGKIITECPRTWLGHWNIPHISGTSLTPGIYEREGKFIDQGSIGTITEDKTTYNIVL